MENIPKMEKDNLMSLLALNDHSGSSSSANTASQDQENAAAAAAYAHATFASMFSGVNLHSLLTSNTTQPLLPLSLFADAYCNLAGTPVASLSPPKPEPPLHQYGCAVSSAADYSIFNHLPDLLTLEQLQSPKRPRLLNHPLPLNLATSTYHQLMPPTAVAAPPPSTRQRRRRQTLSDKTRCLAKLLPWDHKMDTATMLHSAHAYVSFLQAQVAALQAMPIVASDSLPDLSRGVGAGGGGRGGGDDVEVLRRLSRSQLLQVMVNSPVLQTWMCRRGVCVFSSEQLALVNRKSAAVRSAMAAAAGSGGQYYSSSFMDSSASASGTN